MSFVEMMLTPDSLRTLSTFSLMSGRAVGMLNRGLRKVTALFLRESQLAFVNKAQPGGASWAPNYGDEPGGYAWFKREVLGLSEPSTGVVNGELRNSLAQEVDLFPKLEGRVGTPKRSGLEFTEGGNSGPFSMKDHSDKWWSFPGGQFPGRPFLPANSWAQDKAAEIMRHEMEVFALAEMRQQFTASTGMDI
jgi:hypothetical protein